MKCAALKYSMVLLTCPFVSSAVFAQTKSTEPDTNGVIVIQDARLPKLVETYIGTQPEGIPGFRIQVFFTARKTNALEVKTTFGEKFPKVEAIVEYDQPYFKVLAGAFRTKLQAEKLLNSVKVDFPGSFVVSSNIPIEDLKSDK